jgi:hypothetical protein
LSSATESLRRDGVSERHDGRRVGRGKADLLGSS